VRPKCSGICSGHCTQSVQRALSVVRPTRTTTTRRSCRSVMAAARETRGKRARAAGSRASSAPSTPVRRWRSWRRLASGCTAWRLPPTRQVAWSHYRLRKAALEVRGTLGAPARALVTRIGAASAASLPALGTRLYRLQRAGSGVNVNLHFHTLVLDGVFSADKGGDGLAFHPAAVPRDTELAETLGRIRHRV